MFCVSSYPTIEKLKLLSCYQDSNYALGVFADYHKVRTANMTRWIKQFLLAGLAGLIRPQHNQRYSLKTKLNAVKDHQINRLSNREDLAKYKIRNISQLNQWIIQYNSDKLTVAYATRKRVRKMGRKVSFDEKKQIVQWVIDHQNNYQEAANKYNVSYQRVYSWVRKYSQSHDWQALKGNRGRNKGKKPVTELVRIAKVSRQAYYKWLKKGPTIKDIQDKEILNLIRQIEQSNKQSVDYDKMTRLIRRSGLSYPVNKKQIIRIMSEHGIKADYRQAKRKRVKEQQTYQAENLLNRKFDQKAANQVWVTDTTELSYNIHNYKVRLHVVLDLYGQYPVSWLITPTETSEGVIKVFKQA